MWFVRVLLNLHKFLGLRRPGRPLLPRRAARRGGPDRLPGLPLVDRPARPRHGASRSSTTSRRRSGPGRAGGSRRSASTSTTSCAASRSSRPGITPRGVRGAVFVGHPYFDELAERPLDDGFLAAERGRGGPVVAILPGSRTQEVTRNLPIMLRAAAKLAARPARRPVRRRLPPRPAPRRWSRRSLGGRALGAPDLEIHAARTPELIRLADVAWAVSGSVGLELMVEALPTVVLYKVRPFDLWVARQFIKAKYISLVNLLADAEVMPEYLTDRDVSGELAALGRSLAGRPGRAGRGRRRRWPTCATGWPCRGPRTAPPTGSSRRWPTRRARSAPLPWPARRPVVAAVDPETGRGDRRGR